MRLYDYWRSSSAYRVRIALRLKGIDYEQVPVNLRQGAHRTLDYLGHNQQGLVPSLESDGLQLTQSLAIIEWLDETYPAPPLLPARPRRAPWSARWPCTWPARSSRSTNLRVLQYLKHRLGLERARGRCAGTGIGSPRASARSSGGWPRWPGAYCVGDEVTLADLCLVPQVYSARRYGCDLGRSRSSAGSRPHACGCRPSPTHARSASPTPPDALSCPASASASAAPATAAGRIRGGS